MTPNKKIAVTGGIGSGKSTFCAILKERGLPVFSCDEIYGEMLRSPDYLAALQKKFPDCFAGGKLDKAKLAQQVFSDSRAKEELENLAHPRVMAELLQRMEGEELSFAEVPLLFEGGYEDLFDLVIYVKRRKKNRLASVVMRDGISPEQVLARMDAQCGEDIYKRKKCVVIENDGSLDGLCQQAEVFLKEVQK